MPTDPTITSQGSTNHVGTGNLVYDYTGTSPGDLIIAIAGSHNDGAITAPSGWTQSGDQSVGSLRSHVFYKLIDSGDTGTVNFNKAAGSTRWYVEFIKVTNATHDPTRPVYLLADQTDQTAGAWAQNVSCPSILGHTHCDLIVHALTREGPINTSPPPSTTDPSGMTAVNDGDTGGGTSTELQHHSAKLLLTSDGATGTKTFSVYAPSGSYIESIGWSFLIVGLGAFDGGMAVGMVFSKS